MSEFIKSPVGQTKNNIWAAYKDVIAELQLLRSSKTDTIIETNQKQVVAGAVKIAEKQDKSKIESVLESLIKLTDEYTGVCFAIKERKKELKDVHNIAVEADTYVALVQAKEKIKADKEDEAKQIIEDAKNKAQKINDDALEKEQEIAAQIQDSIDDYNKDSKRKKEEFEYSFKRDKKEQEDKLQDELDLKKKSLNDRESKIEAQELKSKELEKQMEDMEDELDKVKVEKDSEVKKQVAIVENRLKRDKEYEIITLKTQHGATVTIKDNENRMLHDLIDDLKTQVSKLQASVDNASERVTTIATASMNAKASEGTVEAVMDAVGKVGQQGKR